MPVLTCTCGHPYPPVGAEPPRRHLAGWFDVGAA